MAPNKKRKNSKLEIPISLDTETITSKPFLKWVGGKTQIIKEIENNLPKKYNQYFEPFLGGGAVYFRLIPKNKQVYLSDINENLISAYLDIRDRIFDVIFFLDKITAVFVNLSSYSARKNYFLKVRANYNSLINTGVKTPLRTAQLIFLNKTCFNGVYRENSKGNFNVPFGDVKNSNSVGRANILAVSRDLQKNTEILNTGYKYLLEKAARHDFIYFDPPYYPLKEKVAFTKYHSSDFTRKDHEELAALFKILDKRGCYLLMSNSFTPFISNLYKEYKKYTVVIDANRNINCKGDLRKPVKEVLIKNYL